MPHPVGNPRRKFIKKIGAGVAAALAYPTLASGRQSATWDSLKIPAAGPNEKYWEMVKRQFAVPAESMMVNSANLCPSPYFIHDQVAHYSQLLAKDVSFQNRAFLAASEKKR